MPSEPDLLDELMRRLREARSELARAHALPAEARTLTRRVRVLSELVRYSVEDEPKLVRCAWCERVEVGGEFVVLEEYFAGALPEGIVERTTHGICPDCAAKGRRPPFPGPRRRGGRRGT